MQGFEDYAKENKIGLWADKNPIAPWIGGRGNVDWDQMVG